MATDFYKVGSSYYRSDTNAKILNTDELKGYATAGGKEITAPTAKAGSVAIANPSEIKNYNVTNNIGGTLYGTLKNPTSSDLTTGMKVGTITPPANTADLVHQTFANNASQYTDGQKTMFSIYEQQQKDAQAAIDKATAAEAENQKNIEQNKTDIKSAYTADMDDENVMGWRQKAIGVTSADLQAKYNDIKTNYDTRKTMVDEVTQLSQMFANELAKPQAVGITSVINARLNNTKEQYAGRISALQAGISALDGNISLAQTFIDNGIETVNADRTDRLNYLNFVQGLYDQKSSDNKESLLTATEEQKKAIENEISIIKGQIEQTESNKEFIRTILTDTQTSLMAIKSGITITDTPDEAVKKMTAYIKAHPAEFDNGKTSWGVVGTDGNGNSIYGFIDTGSQSISTPNISTGATSTSLMGNLTVTAANGSNSWTNGLDVVLAGGKGAAVSYPFSDTGTVIAAGQNGGFGNQVKIKTSAGDEIWFSHLNNINVKAGDKVTSGTFIGAQGNSGNVYSANGGDGTHLDITMKDKNGNFYTPQQVSSIIGVSDGEQTETQLYAGLKGATATAVRSKVSSFKSEAIVTNFNVINEGYNFAKSISTETTNPADDQALIYAFAKAMDPNSVVREGEYATAQKYAQSWIKAYGKSIEQAIAGTGFLSKEARANIKKTIETKYKSSESNYKNVYNQYVEGINNLTGRNDGEKFLTDYAAAYQEPETTQTTTGETIINNSNTSSSQSTPSTEKSQGFLATAWNWLFGN